MTSESTEAGFSRSAPAHSGPERPSHTGARLRALVEVAEIDPPFGEVVRRDLQRYAVTCEDPDAVLAYLPARVREHARAVRERDPELRVGQHFLDNPVHLEHLFLGHTHLRCKRRRAVWAFPPILPRPTCAPQGRCRYSRSNAFSRSGCTPRRPSTTRFAQSKYSRLRVRDHPTGGWARRSRRLQILSASLTSLARRERCGACSICRRLRVCLCKRLLSVTSITTSAMPAPNVRASSACVVCVSSTVSWRIAALRVAESEIPPSLCRTRASSIG